MNQGIKYESMSLGALRELDNECAEIVDRMKARRADITEELLRRYRGLAQKRFEAAEKQSGEITIDAEDGRLKAKIDKKVEWDSAVLRGVAASMPWESAQRLFDIKLSVPERTYNAITDDALRAQITEARTVKYGELKITLE